MLYENVAKISMNVHKKLMQLLTIMHPWSNCINCCKI